MTATPMVKSPNRVLPLLQWFVRYCEEEGIQQTEAAALLGVGQGTVSRWRTALSRGEEPSIQQSALAKLRAFRDDRTRAEYVRTDPVRNLVHEALEGSALQGLGSEDPSVRDRLAYATDYAIRKLKLPVAELARLSRITNNLILDAETEDYDADQSGKARPKAD